MIYNFLHKFVKHQSKLFKEYFYPLFYNKFNYIFFNENEFPYLEKVYDSKEKGYDYHVKLFKINYKEFENVI